MIGISVMGRDDVIRRIQPVVNGRAHRAGLERGIRELVEVLKRYPPYRYVPQRIDYSERQRRFVMAAIREGRITPGRANRSGRLRRGWQSLISGDSALIYNEEPGGDYVMGDRQTGSHARRGWRTVDDLTARNAEKFMRRYRSAVDDALNGRL